MRPACCIAGRPSEKSSKTMGSGQRAQGNIQRQEGKAYGKRQTATGSSKGCDYPGKRRHAQETVGMCPPPPPPQYLQWQLPSSLGHPPTKWCTPAALPLAALAPLLSPSGVNLVSSGRCHNRLSPCLASLSGRSTPAAHDALLLLSLLLLMQPMRHAICSQMPDVSVSALCQPSFCY